MVNPIVNVSQGELEGGEGFTDTGKMFYYFKGIPYAEPPIGKLRFKPPQPVKPWLERKIANKEGNKSVQINFLQDGKIIGDENCLFLNVYTPQLPQRNEQLYPVMVFIHGGGFRTGSGNSEEFGPDFFVEKDTILVTLNYRLDVLGFLCLDSPDVPGNAGLRDQNLAMRWVKENIQFFNGDSNNITIFGVSAGSASVEYHMLSPMSDGLYNKAILESGSVLNPWTRNTNPLQLAHKLADFLGLGAENSDELLKQLQNTELENLFKCAPKVIDDDAIKLGELFGFGPVVEKSFEFVDKFLTKDPLEILKSGNFSKVPTMAGFCSNEGGMFKMFYGSHLNNLKNKRYADYMGSLKLTNAEKFNEKMIEVYKRENVDEIKSVDNYLSDLLFVSGINAALRYRLQQDTQNYMYLFSYEGNLKIDLPLFRSLEGNGSLHGSDLIYLSKLSLIDENKASPEDHRMRNRLTSMWTNFAKNGNPTPKESLSDLSEWSPITKENFKLLEINNELKMRSFPWGERVKLWDEVYN